MLTVLAEIKPEYLLFGGAGLISLVAFTVLILAPAVSSFGRTWEKMTAALLSVIVLAALVGIGVALGAIIVYYWDGISNFLPG